MIGVVVNEGDFQAAQEFFELFKTPWECAVPGKKYRVMLAANGEGEHIDANVRIVYGIEEYAIDHAAEVQAIQLPGPMIIEWQGGAFPVYGKLRLFPSNGQEGILKLQGQLVGYRALIGGRVVWRIGYSLFDEIRLLLTKGQPAAHALTPTLDLHIEVLRHVLIESKIPFLEALPKPAGFEFICCLTHDVDFFGIRRHKFDRTLAGFLYRASIGSMVDLVLSRRRIAEVIRNWLAACSLPLIYAGLLPDFWRPFDDYAKVEDRRRSTFFLVPFKGKPGVAPDGSAIRWRATPYGIADIQEEVRAGADGGSELGVHGIDAWRDSDAGQDEMRQLSSVTGQKSVGIRMHWLYFDENSPGRLESAGFDYDSTWGYNDAVGYRAGTSQMFRPLMCKTLLELPMSIMDSALFTRGRMALDRESAAVTCRRIVSNVKRFGGTLVINWHDRSLAPERLWGSFYKDLLEEIDSNGRVWFARAGEAAAWFRWRRSIRFVVTDSPEIQHVEVSASRSINSGVILRLFRPELPDARTEEILFDGSSAIDLKLLAS